AAGEDAEELAAAFWKARFPGPDVGE
ncbi:MAG: hypothetical protein RL596_1200, partial [Bacteroidota bacterium]